MSNYNELRLTYQGGQQTAITLSSNIIQDYEYQYQNIEAVEVPEIVEEIGEYAFCDNSLTSITLNEGLEMIHNQAFQHGTYSAITIPSTVTYIGVNAFNIANEQDWGSAGNLTITCLATVPPMLVDDEGITFGTPSMITAIYVPSGSVSAYQQAWPAYASKIQGGAPAPADNILTNLDIASCYVGNSQVDKIYLGSEQVYPTAGPTDYASMYLTVEIISASTATSTKRFPISNSGLSYSVNDGPWTQAPSTATSGNPLWLTVSPGDIIKFKGIGAGKSAFQTSSQNIALYDVYGNILSLEYGDNFVGQTGFTTNYRPFYSVFRNNGMRTTSKGGVRSAEHLVLPPTVVEDCYRSCFHGNHLMEVGPELPAKTPAVGCYFFMFGDCYSLTSSPVIQLESLVSGSCYQMLQYCSGLTEITCLAESGIDQDDSTTNWVQDVASTGTFYKHPNATWPTGNNGIPTGWTVQDYVEPNP